MRWVDLPACRADRHRLTKDLGGEQISRDTWIVQPSALNWKGKLNRRIQRLRHVCDRSRQPGSPSCLPLEQ